MASSSFVLFVDNVRVGTLENSVPISLKIPYVAVPVPVLPIFSEDGLNLQIAYSTSNRDEVLIVFLLLLLILLIITFSVFLFLEPV
jgi:hypothetical protein